MPGLGRGGKQVSKAEALENSPDWEVINLPNLAIDRPFWSISSSFIQPEIVAEIYKPHAQDQIRDLSSLRVWD
jgi:hypothetical protein